MKKLLSLLSVLTISGTAVPTTIAASPYNKEEHKIQQDTIYIDENGNQQTTNKIDLWNLNSKEIIQIGFYKNGDQIKVVRMPTKVEKVPEQLSSEITSLNNMFWNASKFNQDISKWNVSNVTGMSELFYDASKFNQDISKWDTSNVTNMSWMFGSARSFNQDHLIKIYRLEMLIKSQITCFFSYWSGIDNPNKLPKFKN